MYKGFRNAIENPDSSWWKPVVFDTLKKEGIIFLRHRLSRITKCASNNNSTSYYRFNGNPRLYYSAYKRNDLKNIADLLARQKLTEAFIFLNNTATTAAIKNSEWIKKYVKS